MKGRRKSTLGLGTVIGVGVIALLLIPGSGVVAGPASPRAPSLLADRAVAPTGVVLPPGVTSYVAIKLSNRQTVATPAPFQQEITINSSRYAPYERANLSNVEFFGRGGGVIPSWLESGASNNSTNSIYWLNLSSGIPARSKLTVYMGFLANGTAMNGINVGEAPELTPGAYGSLDSGAAVFESYTGFASTSVPRPFVTGIAASGQSGSVSVSLGHGLTVDINCSVRCASAGMGFTVPKNQSYILDLYQAQENPGSTGWYSNEWTGTSSIGSHLGGEGYWSGGATGSPAPGQPAVMGYIFDINATYDAWYSCTYWYNSTFSTSTTQGGNGRAFQTINVCVNDKLKHHKGFSYDYPEGIYMQAGSYLSLNVTFDWARLRAYPPNGVMPTFTVASRVR